MHLPNTAPEEKEATLDVRVRQEYLNTGLFRDMHYAHLARWVQSLLLEIRLAEDVRGKLHVASFAPATSSMILTGERKQIEAVARRLEEIRDETNVDIKIFWVKVRKGIAPKLRTEGRGQ